MIKVNVLEVRMDLKDKETLLIKSEMIDMEDAVPACKNYVMLTFEEYEKLSGTKPKIALKPKKIKKK